jgi:biopolymer transport protein ExbB
MSLDQRYRFFCTVIMLLLGLAAQGNAQTLESITVRQEAKLEDAIKRLGGQRKEIQAAQIPLAKELSALQVHSKELTGKLAASRAVRDSSSVSLEVLKEQVEAQEKEYDYITRTLFSEFVGAYQTALSAGEAARHGEAIREHNLFQEGGGSESEKVGETLELLGDSIDRIDQLIGGKRYEGKALSSDGKLLSGKFLQVGPMVYFGATAGANAGWIEESRLLQPKIREVLASEAALINRVVRSGEGNLPMDPTLGDAIAIAETEETVMEHLEKGGVWVYPIVAFAVIATIVALFKLLQIFLISQPAPLVVHEIVKLLRAGKPGDAKVLAAAQPEPTREMLLAAVEHADESIELVEEVMYESMLSTQPRLERFLNVIAVTAATAPLLGLLGTVTGIIKTFKLMKVFGAGDPKPLISGISEALITTELGLVLAIPALVIHALLSRRVAAVLSRMEKLSVAFLNGLARREQPSAKEVVRAD